MYRITWVLGCVGHVWASRQRERSMRARSHWERLSEVPELPQSVRTASVSPGQHMLTTHSARARLRCRHSTSGCSGPRAARRWHSARARWVEAQGPGTGTAADSASGCCLPRPPPPLLLMESGEIGASTFDRPPFVDLLVCLVRNDCHHPAG